MNQTVREYWLYNGSIENAINDFLKRNSNYIVKDLQIVYEPKYGTYALVVYEYVNKEVN